MIFELLENLCKLWGHFNPPSSAMAASMRIKMVAVIL